MSTISNHELGLAVNEVITELTRQNQAELGWIHSETRHVKGYDGQTESNKELQIKVDHAVGGMSVIYLFALLESYIPRWLWEYGNEDMKLRMYAYLHIRNTIAHGFNGKRADRYANKFNQVMESEKPISGIISYTEDTIKLDSMVWQELKELIPSFLTTIINNATSHGSTVEERTIEGY